MKQTDFAIGTEESGWDAGAGCELRAVSDTASARDQWLRELAHLVTRLWQPWPAQAQRLPAAAYPSGEYLHRNLFEFIS